MLILLLWFVQYNAVSILIVATNVLKSNVITGAVGAIITPPDAHAAINPFVAFEKALLTR